QDDIAAYEKKDPDNAYRLEKQKLEEERIENQKKIDELTAQNTGGGKSDRPPTDYEKELAADRQKKIDGLKKKQGEIDQKLTANLRDYRERGDEVRQQRAADADLLREQKTQAMVKEREEKQKQLEAKGGKDPALEKELKTLDTQIK